MLYDSECWAKKKQSSKCYWDEDVRWMNGKTRKDRIRNEDISDNPGVEPINIKWPKTA